MRIEIRGVIVGAEYDCAWCEEWIRSGLITPESRFRAALAKVEKEPLDVYVNSVGGSVFAGYEMANAVKDWAKANSRQRVTVTIGALAASAASTFAVMVGGKMRLHRNSKLMFHGASTETWGGAQAHKDEAELLDKINAEIKTALVTRYNLAPERVNEWFAEGRMGWLTADEAMTTGMGSEIVDADDAEVEYPQVALDGMQQRGLAVAALLQSLTNTHAGTPKGDADERNDPDAAPGADAQAPTEPQGRDADVLRRTDEAYQDGLAAGRAAAEQDLAQRIVAATADLTAKLDAATATATELGTKLAATETNLATAQAEAAKVPGLTADLAKAGADIATLTELLAAEHAASKRLRDVVTSLSPGLSFAEPAVESNTTDWRSALAECGNDYVAARKRFPTAYAAFMRPHVAAKKQ